MNIEIVKVAPTLWDRILRRKGKTGLLVLCEEDIDVIVRKPNSFGYVEINFRSKQIYIASNGPSGGGGSGSRGVFNGGKVIECATESASEKQVRS